MLLLAILVLAVVLYFVFRITVNGFGAAIERHQRDLEFLLFTGRIPPNWMPRKPLPAADESTRSRAERRARRKALRNLKKLIGYYRHSPLVADEGERDSKIGRMKAVGESWKESQWEEIVLP
jgi:hypothetical protein